MLRATMTLTLSLTTRRAERRLLLATVLAAAALLAWDASGLDMAVAAWAGGPDGFAWREHWLLTAVMHSGMRYLAWGLALALCLGVWWPVGPLRALPMSRRLQLAVGVLLATAVVSLLKATNPASCPWDLAAFGGVARPVSHWAWWSAPAGAAGHCFPAGHASAGFAFVSGFFAFRGHAPALARRWLLVALGAGLLLGLAQQWRGAHFMSHTLWSGWACWCTAWALDALHGQAVRRGLVGAEAA